MNFSRIAIVLSTGLLSCVMPVRAPVSASASPTTAAKTPDEALAQISAAFVAGYEPFARVMPKLRPLLDGMRNPQQVRASAPELRKALAEVRTALRVSEGMFAAIQVRPEWRLGDGLALERVLQESRDANREMRVTFDFLDEFLGAIERDDRVRMRALMPRVASSSFVLLRGGKMLFRNRQLSTPATSVTHQTAGVMYQLYRAMDASAQSWFAAKFGGDVPTSMSQLQAELRSVAREAPLLSVAGRKNLVGHLRQIEGLQRMAKRGSETAEALGRIYASAAANQHIFAIGEELARWAEQNSSVTAAQVEAQQQPELLGQLIVLENQAMQVSVEQARLAAQ